MTRLSRSVTSLDGTRVAYEQSGQGPGLVFVHGSLTTPRNYSDLIAELSQHFTVCAIVRRGFEERSHWQNFSPDRDIEDVAAVIEQSGATNLFGYSLGAIVALGAAARLPTVSKLAVYEPPLFASADDARPMIDRLNGELEEGRIAAALVRAMVGAHLGAPWFNAMPRWLLEFLTGFMMTYGEKTGEYRSFRQLAPTLRHDGEVILAASGAPEAFTRITARTRLMGGSKSSKFLKAALARLEQTIPNAERSEIEGMEHGSAQNADFRGNPGPIARDLLQFFTSQTSHISLTER